VRGHRRDRAIRLANELCDLVQVRSGQDGTTIRIHTRRSARPTGSVKAEMPAGRPVSTSAAGPAGTGTPFRHVTQPPLRVARQRAKRR